MFVQFLAVRRPHQIVLAATVDFDEAQRRLGPVDAVAAFGVAHPAAGMVVHQVPPAVQDHILAEAVRALPGAILPDHDLRRPGMMQLEAHSLQPIDQEVVDEDLQPGTDVRTHGPVQQCRGRVFRRRRSGKHGSGRPDSQNDRQDTKRGVAQVTTPS